MIYFFFSPHFFPGWILALFFGHSSFIASTGILRISHLFIGISLDFTQPTQFCSLSVGRFRRVSVIVATSSSELLVSIIQSIHRIQRLSLHGIDTLPFLFSKFLLSSRHLPTGRTDFTTARTLTKRTELHGWTNERRAFLLSYDLKTHTMHFIGYPHKRYDEYFYRYSHHHRIF